MNTHKPYILTLLMTASLTAAAVAGVDHGSTQGGADAPSGTRDFWTVNDIDRLLMDFNEKFTYSMTLTSDPTKVLDAQPYEKQYTLGEIMNHSGSTKLIYDRLAVRVVVQVLGFDDGSLPGFGDEQFFAITNDRQVHALPAAPHIGGGGAGARGRSFQPPPPPDTPLTPTPEPATGMVLAIGAAAALGSRRTRFDRAMQ